MYMNVKNKITNSINTNYYKINNVFKCYNNRNIQEEHLVKCKTAIHADQNYVAYDLSILTPQP